MTATHEDRNAQLSPGVAIKAPCRAATTGAITLSGEQTIDGVACVALDRVLVKNQASSIDNGIYTVATGSWSRAQDFDGNRDVVTGTFVFITSGTVNAGAFYECTTTGNIVFGSSNITFAVGALGPIVIPLSASLVNFTPAGTGAVTRTVQSKERDIVSLLDLAGVDPTGATSSAAGISAAWAIGNAGGPRIYGPKGQYLVDQTLSAITGQFEFVGDGAQQTEFVHNPSVDGDCILLSNGASLCTHVKLYGFSVKTTDTTHTKKAIHIKDGSVCHLEDIYVYGNGAGVVGSPAPGLYYSGGTGSVALQIDGREKISIEHYELIADLPILIGANPNSAATNCEDSDSCSFVDGYLLGNGNYNFTVLAGHGVQNLVLRDNNFVGGTGGFFLNDSRVAPTVSTHDINIENTRCEQCTDANGYGANLTFLNTSAPGPINFKNFEVDSTSQGVKITLGGRVEFNSTTMATAAGKNALLFTPYAVDSTVKFTNCYWQPSSVVTLTSMTASIIEAWNTSLNQAPATATYVYTVAGTLVNVATVTANSFFSLVPRTGTSATDTITQADTSFIANRAGTITLTLETASAVPGRILIVRTIQAQAVVSAGSNVVPLVGGAAGTAILAATAGKWAMLQSDGANWQIMMGN